MDDKELNEILEELIREGLMEIKGLNEEGELTFGLTRLGEEYVDMLRRGEEL